MRSEDIQKRDIFALGCILFKGLTGKVPVQKATRGEYLTQMSKWTQKDLDTRDVEEKDREIISKLLTEVSSERL